MKKIYLLGTEHHTLKYVKRVTTIIKRYNIECILYETVKGINKKELFSILPLYYISLYVYSYLLKSINKIGDFNYVISSAKRLSIPSYRIDLTIKDVLTSKKWLYFLLQTITPSIIFFTFTNINRPFISLIITVMITPIFLVGSVALISINQRNRNFAKKIIKYTTSKKYTNILFVCGKYHLKSVKKLLTKQERDNISVEIIT